MRVFPMFNLLFSSVLVFAHEPLWQIETEILTPESAFYDETEKVIYISNVAGIPTEKDGKGWISKLSSTGQMLEAKWIDGIDAPKGMRIFGGELWVSNIDEVLVIQISERKIKERIKIAKAKFLNDVAIDSEGVVYVSDTLGSAIYRIRHGKVDKLISGKVADAPNGLLVVGNDLIVAAWGMPKADWSTKVPGRLYKINLKTKRKSVITKKPLGNLDGLELDRSGNFIVSDWIAGKVFKISSEGKVETFLENIQNSADLGVVPETNTLLVPSMSTNRVLAFRLP